MSEKFEHFVNPWNHPIFEENSFNKVELDQMKQKIEETTEKRRECLDSLIQKLNEQRNFTSCLDERFLLGHLRVSKFNTTKACDRILKLYRQYKKQSHTFGKVCDSAISKTKWYRHCVISPHRMKDNSIIIIKKYCLAEPHEVSFEENFYLGCLICNQLSMSPAIQLGGVTVIMDFSGLTFQKLLTYTPKRIAAYANFFQDTFPISQKRIHVINVNDLFYLAYKILYPLLNKKIKSRVVLHSYDATYKSLHAYIPPELLPEEYGGLIKQSEIIDIMSAAREMSQEFQKHSKFGFINKRKFR